MKIMINQKPILAFSSEDSNNFIFFDGLAVATIVLHSFKLGYSPVITDDKDRLTSSQIYQNENENVVQSKRS
jgi:hypothetical protein